MNGDFSRIEPPQQNDIAFLVQQARPLLDSQFNTAILTMLRLHEDAMSRLAPSIEFPSNDPPLRIVATPAAIQFPCCEIYVRGIPATVVDSQLNQGELKIADGRLLDQELHDGTYSLVACVFEETVSYERVETERALKFERFSDPAIPSGDSLRVRRFAQFRLFERSSWEAKRATFHSRPAQALQIDFDERATQNQLLRFEPIVEGEAVTQLKWSRDNAALTFPIKNTSGASVFVADLDSSMLDILPGQYVELLSSDADAAFRRNSLIEIKEVRRVEGEIVLVSELGTADRASFVRIWEKPLQANGSDGLRTCRGSGFRIRFPAYSEVAPYQGGDYWQIPVRIGGMTFQASRQSAIRACEEVCRIEIDGNRGIRRLRNVDSLNIANETPVTQSDHPAPSPDSEPAANMGDATNEMMTSHFELDNLFDSTSCGGLIATVRSPMVKKWLASLCYAELCADTESELRNRMMRDCHCDDTDCDLLDADIERVIQERRNVKHQVAHAMV